MKWFASYLLVFTLISITTQANAQGAKPTPPPTQAPVRPAPKIARFAPINLSNTVNQIRVVFSEPMIRIRGGNASADIFNVECQAVVKGAGRWNDDRTWIFDFETSLYGNNLPGGTVCNVTLKPGTKTLAGRLVQGQSKFRFQIDGPNILRVVAPSEKLSEDAVLVLITDTAVDPQSVQKASYFQVANKASTVPVELITNEKLAKEILNSVGMDADEATHYMIVKAKENFPANSKVTFVWGPGIKAVGSPATRQSRSIHPFVTREQFAANFTCTRENARADCHPLLSMQVNFTSDISKEDAAKITLTASDGKTFQPQLDTSSEYARGVRFEGPFPILASLKLNLPANLKDETGRALTNAVSFPLTVKTADLPPLIKFASDFGVIESKLSPILLPATLRNLEAQKILKQTQASVVGAKLRIDPTTDFASVIRWLRLSEGRSDKLEGRDKSILNAEKNIEKIRVPLSKNGRAFEVVGIPLQSSGFYVVELESLILGQSLLGADKKVFVSTASLVTNLSVHMKRGRESSLFWVTELDSGKPVDQAQVKLFDCAGRQLWSGTTAGGGVATFNGEVSKLYKSDACQSRDTYSKYDSGIYATAQVGNDLTFTHSSWNDGIESWRFGNIAYSDPSWGNNSVIGHSVLARSLLRAGETVHMKHFLRRKSSQGFGSLTAEESPNEVWVEHNDSGDKFTIPVQWEQSGQGITTWQIPKEAKLGLYTITLVRTGKQPITYTSSNFRVEAFKVPLMKGKISVINANKDLVQPGTIQAQVGVDYQNGGPASNQEVTFTSIVSAGYGKTYTEFDAFSFGQDKIQEYIGPSDGLYRPTPEPVVQKIRLNTQGTAVFNISGLSGLTEPKLVSAEARFRDANGEDQTVGRTFTVWPSEILSGIKIENRYSSKKDLTVKVATVDTKGKALAGNSVNVSVYTNTHYTHRTRLVGGFYSYENMTEVKRTSIPVSCDGATGKDGTASCRLQLPDSGSYIVQAETRDAKGNISYASQTVYVSGSTRQWFSPENNDRMDLLAEKQNLNTGEEAVLQLRMPYDEATVLVTIEREGVIDHFVQTVRSSSPVIRFKIKEEYSPNVYVSALAVKGRIADKDADALVDLGKPSFKLGLASLQINWKTNTLKVTAKPVKEVLKPRETAQVRVAVQMPDGKAAANAEVAIAVVDEGLLELQKNQSWDLLDAMMGHRSLEVETSTMQMQIVGKRHFGLKASPIGGDGGSSLTRELFDTLVHWEPKVQLDANGAALVSFTMNDSLTKFRVVAIATAGNRYFGKGETSVTTEQSFSGTSTLAQFARQGDEQIAEVTLRNSTKDAAAIAVSGSVQFKLADGRVVNITLPPQTAQLPAKGSGTANLGSVKVPEDAVSALYDIRMTQNGQVVDQIRKTQSIEPSVLTRTFMTQMEQLGSVSKKVELPREALQGRGGVRVQLIGSLGDSLSSIGDAFGDSVFAGIENKISKAVATQDRKLWDECMKELPTYLDTNSLVKFYVSDKLQGHAGLTAYILSVSQRSGMPIPSDIQEKLVIGLTNFIEGRDGRDAKKTTPIEYFVTHADAIEVLARMGRAQAQWVTNLPVIETAQLPNGTLVDMMAVYSRLQNSVKMKVYDDALRARLTLAGTRLVLNDVDLYEWWIAANDYNQAELISTLIENKNLISTWTQDLPRLLNGLSQAMRKSYWSLSVTNAQASLALRAFASVFEKERPKGETVVSLDSETRKFLWDQKAATLDFNWGQQGIHNLEIKHRGQGQPWAFISTSAAIPTTAPVSSGVTVSKTVTAIQQAQPNVWSRGDLAEIRLKIKSQAALSDVTLNDPIPAGAKILGSGLGGGSDAPPSNSIWPAYEQLGANAYQAYYNYIPATEIEVVYRIRLSNSGKFKLPATRVEALYTPEVFGEAPNNGWDIR